MTDFEIRILRATDPKYEILYRDKHCNLFLLQKRDEMSTAAPFFMYNNLFSDLKPNTLFFIDRPSILDREEKRYLESIFRPFKDKINYVVKTHYVYKNLDYLIVKYSYRHRVSGTEQVITRLNNFNLPPFQEGSMYCGMRYDMPYSLSELGLFI